MKKISAAFTGLLLFLTTALSPVFAATTYGQAYGSDTVAGYASELKSSLLTPGQSVLFQVERPDGSTIRIPAQADAEGIARTDFYGHQTKTAGIYKVALVLGGSREPSAQSRFTVYAGELSPTQSMITVNQPLIAADGTEKSFVVVTLYDAYQNPIAGHQVKLFSSRFGDQIEAISQGVTSERGQATFKIASRQAGVSTLTAYDITLGKELVDREEVVFMTPTPKTASLKDRLTASLFKADIGQGTTDVTPGPVDHFDIEDLPNQVKMNELVTFTVVAKDKDGNTATNYTGTILISVPEDENASLPSSGEYTFKASDQGRFTFTLALSFSKVGNQVLQVFDKNNFRIAGEKPVEVVSAQAAIPAPTGGKLSIKSPSDGSELASSTILLSGTGDPFINLKIFDNDAKIGDSETDGDGFFTFQAQALSSGPHTFYVMSDRGEVSPAITVMIDTLPPVLNQIEVFPDGILRPGTPITVRVQSEAGLESAKLRLQGAEQVLTESATEPGTYEASMVAPAAEGNFPVDVILIDRLANKTEAAGKLTLQVQEEKLSPPATVQGLNGVAGDGEVTLVWSAIENHERAISKYRVYYGTQLDALTQTAETADDKTTLVITGLENNVQTFFAVTAVDSQNLESPTKSTAIAVTPISAAPESDAEPVSVTPSGLTGVAGADSVTLSWTPFGGLETAYYKIYFGVQPNVYIDDVVASANLNQFTINDLIRTVPYYFAMVALDINGREITGFSNEIQVTPGAGGLYPSAPVTPTVTDYTQDIFGGQLGRVPRVDETGPEVWWVLIVSLVFAHLAYHHHKRRLS